MREKDQIIMDLREKGEDFTLSIFKALLNELIKESHVASEGTTGDADLLIKGKIKAYRQLLKYVERNH